MAAHTDFAKNNEEYAATFGEKGTLPLKPGKKLAIGEYQLISRSLTSLMAPMAAVTCMDARIKYVHIPGISTFVNSYFQCLR